MAKWTFEPGHTAAEFSARHMMVTHVRGHFKDVHGTLNFDPENPADPSVEVVIDARKVWTGERRSPPQRRLPRRGKFPRDHFPRRSGRRDRRGGLPREW